MRTTSSTKKYTLVYQSNTTAVYSKEFNTKKAAQEFIKDEDNWDIGELSQYYLFENVPILTGSVDLT